MRQGKEALQSDVRALGAAGVKATVEHTIAGEDRAAAAVTCAFPGGRKVLVNAILEIEDGRMVRDRYVLAGDPKAS